MSSTSGVRQGWGFSLLRVFVITAAIASAVGLTFVTGLAVDNNVPDISSRAVGTVGLLVVTIAVIQFLAQVAALMWAGKVHRTARLGEAELAARNDQLWLVNRLCSLLERENDRRSVGNRLIDFWFEEFEATGVACWMTNVYGAVEMPDPARFSAASGRVSLPDTERVVLARNASRDWRPLVVEETNQPRALDPSRPPTGSFLMFLPLVGDDICEGVLEVAGSASGWRFGRWQLLTTIAGQIAAALQRARAYDQLQQRAEEDYVTGLFNHGYMQSYLEKAMQESDSTDEPLALMFFDVNDFKSFNDTLGHGAGDRVLQIVADKLRLMSQGLGVVGRSGGDEFMIIMPRRTADDADKFIKTFQTWLAERAPAINGVYRIRVSCGHAIYPIDAHNRHELLAAADVSLYQNKRKTSLHSRAGGDPEESPPLGVYGLLDRLVENVHCRDPYSRKHSEATADYAIVLARHLGLSPSAEKTLRLASLLHDVGKIGVPETLLAKPGPLSEGEFDVVKHQLSIAEQLIVDIPNAQEVRSLVLLHHERWDGTGYPRGLHGEEIPYLARLLSVADAFAAITLDRPYKKGLTVKQALREIRKGARTQFDPSVVAAFCEAMAGNADKPAEEVASRASRGRQLA